MKKYYIIGVKKQKVDAKWFCEIVKKYNKSSKGKETRAKWVEKNKEKIQNYNKDYQKRMRKYCIDNNLCQHCKKKIVRITRGKKRTTCIDCWKINRERNKMRAR